MNLHKFEAEITPLIEKRFSDIEAYQQKCYANNRERQLRDFRIGWTPEWSQAELINALNKKLQTLRKMAKRAPWSPALVMRPMLHAAFTVEVELAKEAA